MHREPGKEQVVQDLREAWGRDVELLHRGIFVNGEHTKPVESQTEETQLRHLHGHQPTRSGTHIRVDGSGTHQSNPHPGLGMHV